MLRGNVKHELRVTSSNPRVESSKSRVRRLKSRFASLKAGSVSKPSYFVGPKSIH